MFTGLSGATVGIFGMGRIGMAVAKRLSNFETKQIIYHNRNERDMQDEHKFKYVDLDSLLAQSDFLICTCALTDETRHFFNIETFKRMKKNAIFINISRGLVVNQEDLYTALNSGIISGAG